MKRRLLDQKITEDGEGFITLYMIDNDPRAFKPEYATWRSNQDTPTETYWGHYFSDLSLALADYKERS